MYCVRNHIQKIMVTLANVTKAYFEIKNGCSNFGCYSSLHFIFSACNTCRAPRWEGKGKCACHRRGRAIREKILTNEHLIQTLLWLISTKNLQIFFFFNVIAVRAHFNRKPKKATKASVGFHEALPRPHALRSVAEDIQINQTGTRIHEDIQTSLVEVKSNLEK